MTNLPAEPAPFWPFGITLVAVCVPFFSIIGFLSTNYGYSIWAKKTKQFWRWMKPKSKSKRIEDGREPPTRVTRTLSTEEGMRLRLKESEAMPRRSSQRPAPSHPHIQRMVEKMGEGRQSGLTRMGTVADDDALTKEKEDNIRASRDTVIDIKEP